MPGGRNGRHVGVGRMTFGQRQETVARSQFLGGVLGGEVDDDCICGGLSKRSRSAPLFSGTQHSARARGAGEIKPREAQFARRLGVGGSAMPSAIARKISRAAPTCGAALPSSSAVACVVRVERPRAATTARLAAANNALAGHGAAMASRISEPRRLSPPPRAISVAAPG